MCGGQVEYWVCTTNKYSNFTYGKIYSVTIIYKSIDDERSVIWIIDDKGASTSSSTLAPRFIIKELMEFIPLNEWRDKKLEQLGI